MHMINALFHSHSEAEEARQALIKHGICEQDISVISQGQSDIAKKELSSHKNSRGIGMGAAAGAGLGTLAGLAALAIPGVGEIEITGWLAALLGGALAGSALGAAAGNMREIMKKAGISEREAQYFIDEVQNGSILITARVEEKDANNVRAILADFNSIKPLDNKSYMDTHTLMVNEEDSPYMQAQREAQNNGQRTDRFGHKGL